MIINKMQKYTVFVGATLLFVVLNIEARAQQLLTLKQAIDSALANYNTIKAKEDFAKAAKAQIKNAQRQYFPDINLQATQNYGTVNGQNGPLYGDKIPGVSSSGPVLPSQS